jgi:hypothetical protein
MRRALLALLSIAVGIPAGAATISFDEIPPANDYLAPPLSEEYAHMGAHFIATDDGVLWSGMSDGDPGEWSLEGTNGSAFVGFNGFSFSLTMLLDEAVEGFQLDVARAAGSNWRAGFTLAGFRNGEFVEETFVDLGATGINEWSTAALSQPVDEVQMIGSGGWQPFGVDNVQWDGEGGGSAMQVDVSVRPGNSNKVNPFSNSTVPVVIYGSESFDVRDVDAATLGFGPNEALSSNGNGANVVDVNGDGYDDLKSHFRVPDTGIAVGDEEACLSGFTWDGVPVQGCAPVETKSQFVNSSEKRKKH